MKFDAATVDEAGDLKVVLMRWHRGAGRCLSSEKVCVHCRKRLPVAWQKDEMSNWVVWHLPVHLLEAAKASTGWMLIGDR